MNVRSLLEEKARQRERDLFLVFQGKPFTYGEFDALVNQVAQGLVRLGIGKEDRVGGFMPNCFEWLLLYFANAKLGAVNVFVNTQYDAELLQHALSISEVKAVLVGSSLWPTYKKIREKLHVDILEVLVDDGEGVPITDASGVIPYEELLSNGSDSPADSGLPGRTPLQFVFTSGTTGLPKPCITSHRYLLSITERISRLVEATREDRVLACLPNYHGNVYIGIFTALMGDSAAVVERRFSVSRYWQWVREYGATILMLHITPMNMLLKQKPHPGDGDHPAKAGIFLVGEGALPFVKRFGLKRGLAMYGSTEAGGFCTMSAFGPDSRHDPRWAGKPRDDVEMAILDENDDPVPTGAPGEIVIRDKTPHTLFSGYYNMAEKTATACRNFWFHSGDTGYMDENGSLYFVGRMEESIRVKGEFIPVDRLEGCIRAHPQVFECAAVGVPSDIGEEDVKLYIQLHQGPSLPPEGLIRYCEENLPKFMVPRYIEFVDGFPMASSAMKIQKVKLKERGIGNAWDRRD
ncbi:MAG: AMP-binding protein [Desulfobacteraceae bacterium]|nr:AMP-binding protein [Desulfobacteraceae bacterium]